MVARPSLKRVVPGSVPPWRALCAESARVLKGFLPILCVSRKFLNLFCCSSRSCTNFARAKLTLFLGQGLARARAAGAGPPPQLLWPSGLAAISEAAVPGHFIKAGFSKRSCRFIKPRWQLYDGCGGKGQPLGLAQPLLRHISSLSAARFPGARCFSWAMFFVAAPWLSSSGSQEKRSFPLCLIGSLSTFAVGQSRERGSLSSSLRLIRSSLSTFAVKTLLALRGAELRSWWGASQRT